MASTIQTIAERLGAKIVAKAPETGGGAFGVARLARIVDGLKTPAMRFQKTDSRGKPNRRSKVK